MNGLFARAASLWRGLRIPARLSAEMEEEMRFHIELEADRLMRERRIERAEALRQAAVAFGGIERYKEEGRDVRGLTRIFGLGLDFKLGLRMLRKFPGLTLVGGVAIAFAICVGVGTFEFIFQILHPTLPLPEGNRVVGIRIWDAAANGMRRPTLDEFVTWREEVGSVEDLGAYRTLERNLITADGRGAPIPVAEMTAAGFRVARVAPLLGRTLTASDEDPAAPPAAVIGHDLWRTRFGADPEVVGRVIRLGRDMVTIVGVMPEGFGFPISHSLWTPMRLNVLRFSPEEMPRVEVFGRLAPGISREDAQAEMTSHGARAAAAFPDTHEHLQPRVMPYASALLDLRAWMALSLLSINGFVLVLLVLVCGNVALLMFARAATRESELVVRSALGASRRRIVVQMFTEALVLAAVAGAVGLAAAGLGLRWLLRVVADEFLSGRLPFWFHGSLSPASIAYFVVLVLVAAVIAGVVPGLRITRSGLEGRLREGAAGGGGPRFGGIWTAVIVVQVALTAFLPYFVYQLERDMGKVVRPEVEFAAGEYLSTRLEMDAEAAAAAGVQSGNAFLAHFAATYRKLAGRLLEEPSIAGITFASNAPGRYHPWNQIEMEGGAVVPLDTVRGHRVSKAYIDPGYFRALGTGVVAGRDFGAGDLEPGASAVIVNRAFVEQVLGGRNALGRRVRYVANESARQPIPVEEAASYEIVGVAPDLGTTSGYGDAGIYHPLSPDSAQPVFLLAQVKSSPAAFAPRLQRLAAEVDPALRLHEIVALDRVHETEQRYYEFWLTLVAILTLITLIVCWAGIYAVTSFAVSRRTREIGIRVAIGGTPRHVALAIFRRPLAQVTLGVAVGAGLIVVLWSLLSDPGRGPAVEDVAGIGGYAAVMLAVCLLACVVPTRRALGVEPMEALRAE